MDAKIHQHAVKLQTLLERLQEEHLEELRDEAMLLADTIEEYLYQRDAQQIIDEFLDS